MPLVRWIAGFVFTVVLAAFAVANRELVSVIWSPLHDPVELPLYLIAAGAFVSGFLFGGIIVWMNGGSVRREKRRQGKVLKDLERKVESMEGRGFDSSSAQPPGRDFFVALPHQKVH